MARNARFSVHPVNFNSIEALKQCALAGTGITVISEIAVQKEIAEGRLVALPWKGKRIYVNLFMIWQKNKWPSPTLKAFMDMTREYVSTSSANDK
jgi:DNA-binding transcriptional LysR family regulator